MTASFWDYTDPLKPFGIMDPDAILDIPFDWTEWLDGNGETYIGHSFTAESPLEVLSSAQVNGVITPIVRVNGEYVPGKKYRLRCHITTANLADDRSVFLMLVER